MAFLSTKGMLACGLAVAAAAFAFRPASAQDATEQTFVRYHAAIHAAEVCEQRKLEQDGLDDPDAARIKANQESMAAVINGKVMGEISAGRRLQLIEEAKRIVDDVAEKKGCDSPEAQDWLALFHAELEPVLVE